VQQRLEDLRLQPPPQVQVIEQWTAVADGEGFALITEQRRLPLPSLASMACELSEGRRLRLVDELRALAGLWRSRGFIHGDISPSNLLITGDDRIVAVDWVLDLRSREGTPRYVPASLAHKMKDFAHDEAAVLQIATALCRRPF
jgi:hypothetical protein